MAPYIRNADKRVASRTEEALDTFVMLLVVDIEIIRWVEDNLTL
jgi:hypothetical protein